MARYFTRHNLTLYSSVFIISLIVNGGIRIVNVWLSPTERVLGNLIFLLTILQVGICVFLLLQLIAKVSTQEIDRQTAAYIFAAILYISAGFLSVKLANTLSRPIKHNGYRAFLHENEFLLNAIQQYEQDRGAPPDSLEALYPNYLTPPIATIRSERIGESDVEELALSPRYQSLDSESAGHVAYQYHLSGSNSTKVSPWELSISIYLGSFKSVRFIYNPAQQYEAEHGRIGNWAYTGMYD